MKRTIAVVGAVIVKDDRVLCVQRGPQGSLPGMWEFPGGKIETGETPQEALTREIDEELGCEIAVREEVTTTIYEYDFAVVELTTFWCEILVGQPLLTEHAALVWSHPAALSQFDWAPADIPAVTLIEEGLGTPLPTDFFNHASAIAQ